MDTVKTPVDIKTLIQTSSIGIYDKTKLINKLKDHFSEEEQKLYVANLFLYLNYHPVDDFVVNLETVWKFIGFSNKANGKRLLKQHFTENKDYKIVFIRSDENPQNTNLGGRPQETIMLNINTFKKLCLKSNTDKADKIHDYYIRLEMVYNELIKEQLKEKDKLLLEKNEQLIETKKRLENKTKLAVKKWYNQDPGHTIYGYINLSNNLITIGKSKNIKSRESDYITHNPDGEMFYIRKCYNCDLAEKVLHHMLDKYREERNREWFGGISEKLTIYFIDTVCDFLDSFINCSEKFPEFKIKEFFSQLPVKKFNHVIDFKIPKNINVSVVYNKNIKDYIKFIKDCCKIEENDFALTFDLRAAYKFWCKRALSVEIYKDFSNWISENYKIAEKYFQNDGIRHKIVLNLKLKKLEFFPNDKYNVKTYEKFCLESCAFDYSYKIKFNDFLEKYTQWMKSKYPEYELTSDGIEEIKDYFNVKFLLDNDMICGIQLKFDTLPFYKLRNLSKIYTIDENKKILNTFNGLSEASENLKLEIKTISDIIRYSKVIHYKDQKVTLVYEKESNIITKRNIQNKIIYKYDFDTKKLLKTFNSTIEAAHHFEITTTTVLRYIAIENVFSCKNDDCKNIFLSYLDNIDDLKIKEKPKVIKLRRYKNLYCYYNNSNILFKEYRGPSDAAAQLKIGQCTVHRHINNKKPLNVNNTPLIFTYNKIK